MSLRLLGDLVVRKYRSTQPKAVATLRRDVRATVTYYHLLQRFSSWRRAYLRTASRIERHFTDKQTQCKKRTRPCSDRTVAWGR